VSARNVILICVDQWRGDCLSAAGHPHVQTPYLDELAMDGVRFSRAYSATPTCVPARVALFTGQSQERHGRVGYNDGIPFARAHPVTMQGEFRAAGYQTQAIGKMHVWPERSRVGFDDVILHDGFLHFARRTNTRNFRMFDDYVPWLRRQPGVPADADYFDNGINCNSMVARPWDRDEHLHPTDWIGTQTVDWLYRRDPTRPFFLYLSFHRPHAPYDPPAWAFDQYLDIEPYHPVLGDWEHHYDAQRRDGDCQAFVGRLPDRLVHRARAGYYGLMTQIDAQINRIRETLLDFGLADDTVIAFTADHGDMMGDHGMYRKGFGYEGSAGIPLLIADAPAARAHPGGRVVDHVVELRDVMPTLLELAGVPVPDTVDGVSLAGFIRGEGGDAPREYLHGEHVMFGQSLQWVTDGRTKYLWASGTGNEELFDLVDDPGELRNLAPLREHAELLQRWRGRLIDALDGREEGFVADGELRPDRPVVTILEHTRARLADQPPLVPATT
jgi:arylsulfatase A-like enzyme